MGNGQVAKEGTADGGNQASARCARIQPFPAFCLTKRLPEIYASVPDYRRECSYYIALGYYKLGNYGHARRFNGGFLILPYTNIADDLICRSTATCRAIEYASTVPQRPHRSSRDKGGIYRSVRCILCSVRVADQSHIYLGIGLVAGAAALGGLVVASLYKQARRR